MPNLANITVKASNGTTDIVYTGIDPGNSQSYSVHKAPPLMTLDSTRPEFRFQVKRQGNIKWVAKGWMMYPYAVTSTDTQVTTVRRRCLGKFEFDVPADVPVATIQEFAAQAGNLLASALVRQCVVEGGNFI